MVEAPQGSGERVERVVHVRMTGGEAPEYATDGSAGFDLKAQIKVPVTLYFGQSKLIRTGIHMEIPSGYELQIRPRSGLALNKGITVLNSPGTVDSDYRGEIGVILLNTGTTPVTISNGMKIAQGVIAPVFQARFEIVESLDDTERGHGGFGSTGE